MESIKKIIREEIGKEINKQVSGPLSGGEFVNIELEQVGNSRKYNVYVNKEKIGEVINKPNYHNGYVDSLLLHNARELAKKGGYIPSHATIKINFIGDINHVRN